MRRIRSILFATTLALIGAGAAVSSAYAQLAVFDPVNFSQNILTALRTLQSNVNEAQQIANQIQQINNQMQNLQRLPGASSASLLGDYVNAWNQMTNTFAGINGLASNIATLTVNYNNLFPARTGAPVSSAQVLSQLQQYLGQARQTYQGVYLQSGAVMASLPQQQADMAMTLATSNGASGNLDALQGQTQMTAQVAQLLAQQNAQVAAMNQAEADWLNEQMELLDSTRAMQTQSEARTAQTSPPAPYLPPIR